MKLDVRLSFVDQDHLTCRHVISSMQILLAEVGLDYVVRPTIEICTIVLKPKIQVIALSFVNARLLDC